LRQSEIQLPRPKRADARVNHDKLVAAARALFTEKGTSAPLEEVAERAGVGIGTLYRHFPTRQALLERVYVDEVEAMARAAADLAALPPWDALTQWLHQYVSFAATKRALNEALMETDPNSNVLLTCRTAISGAGTALVERAQRAGVVRTDTNFMDVVRMVGAIAMVPTEDPGQQRRLLELALDGLRYHAHERSEQSAPQDAATPADDRDRASAHGSVATLGVGGAPALPPSAERAAGERGAVTPDGE
jgi:AcrR family transcriptional regulator